VLDVITQTLDQGLQNPDVQKYAEERQSYTWTVNLQVFSNFLHHIFVHQMLILLLLHL